MRQKIRVAVFGRADVTFGIRGHVEALELRGLIAREGWVVLSGGYGGALEAGHLPPRPLVLVDPDWERLAETLRSLGTAEENLLQ